MSPDSSPRRRAAVITWDQNAEDVARARHGVRNAGVTFGPEPRSSRTGWRAFTDRYGWRAYAVPILVVVTIAALFTTTEVRRHAARHAAQRRSVAPPVASSSITLKNDDPAGNVHNTVLRAAQLPPGAAYTKDGTGTFRVLPGHSKAVGSGHLYRYSIEVEKGVAGVDIKQFQQLVVATLSDRRSWTGHGVALQRVDSGAIDFRISLTSAMTVRDLCGYSLPVETSCYASAGAVSDVNRVVLNVARYTRGSTAYVGDLPAYRVYMINHETGHALSHMHAHQCLPGGLAPVMMQQTFGLRSATTGQLCEANPWPYPAGVKGAPGAEQPDTPQNDEYGLGD